MPRFVRSFREWLKNPRLFRREAMEYERQLEELNAPADPQTIQRMVEHLLLEETDPPAHERIRAQGTRAVPALVSALQDPRFCKQKLGQALVPSGPSSVCWAFSRSSILRRRFGLPPLFWTTKKKASERAPRGCWGASAMMPAASRWAVRFEMRLTT